MKRRDELDGEGDIDWTDPEERPVKGAGVKVSEDGRY